MKVCRGFTLLELMVTIAVVAILATVGVPGFRDLIQNNRVTTQTNEIVNALAFARTEAIKRGRAVEVDIVDGNPGWSATVAFAETDGEVLRVFDRTRSGILIDGPVKITFAPTGSATAAGSVFLQPGPGCSGEKRRQVQVGLSGQITTSRLNCE